LHRHGPVADRRTDAVGEARRAVAVSGGVFLIQVIALRE
jgi:hypothetical protein